MTIGDTRFFARSGPHPLADVAEAAGGMAAEADLLLTGVAPLHGSVGRLALVRGVGGQGEGGVIAVEHHQPAARPK